MAHAAAAPRYVSRARAGGDRAQVAGAFDAFRPCACRLTPSARAADVLPILKATALTASVTPELPQLAYLRCCRALCPAPYLAPFTVPRRS